MCRHAQLITHFGDANTFAGGRCGDGCDNCLRADTGDSDVQDGGFDWGAFDDGQVCMWSGSGSGPGSGTGSGSGSGLGLKMIFSTFTVNMLRRQRSTALEGKGKGFSLHISCS